MAGNTKAFREQLGKFNTTVRKKHVALVTRVARAAHETAFQMTPIDTSRAMSGWVSQVNVPFMEEPVYTPGSKGSTLGEAVALNMTNINDTAAQYKFGQDWIIRNNVPYIELLEAGHSQRQAPAGMMSFALQAANRAAKR
jgi:hypothetical protein